MGNRPDLCLWAQHTYQQHPPLCPTCPHLDDKLHGHLILGGYLTGLWPPGCADRDVIAAWPIHAGG